MTEPESQTTASVDRQHTSADVAPELFDSADPSSDASTTVSGADAAL